MGWQTMAVEDLLRSFVAEHGHGLWGMSELCARYGISRKTGYKWLARFAAEGPAGLRPRSHAPHVHGRATAPELAQMLVALKLERPSWGPRKLVARLAHLHPEVRWPAHSTAGRILADAGLVASRTRRRQSAPTLGRLTPADVPNRVWTADYKGWFRLGDGGRCEPLSLADGASRFLLALSCTTRPSGCEARPVFERAFATYGLPDTLRTDNGPPFAAVGGTGLSRLSAWLARLGIRHERIAPGRPQQNGAHERFHATLSEATRAPCAEAGSQQARFDAFRAIYNHERPHEALGQVPPAARYVPSPRPYPVRIPEPDYPREAAVRRVRCSGEIKWQGDLLYVSQAIIGESVAIQETEAGDMEVFYYARSLGFIDPIAKRIRSIPRKLSPIKRG